MTTLLRRHLLFAPVSCLALALLADCGSSPTAATTPPSTTPPTTPPTTLPPCAQTALFGPTRGSLPAMFLGSQDFTTTTTGRVDVILDWTFDTSPMGVYVVQGACKTGQFNARTCNFLIRSEPPGPKPRKVSASNVAPGTYTLLIDNFANVQEQVSVQVTLSSSTCPPLATAGTMSVPGGAIGTLSHPTTN